MPDSGPSPDTPPTRRPTLADQHWRALLRHRADEDLQNDMVEAVEKNDAWRFSMLLQLSVDWPRQERVLQSMIEHDRFDMFKAVTARDKEWHNSSTLTSLASQAAENGKLDFLKIFVEQYKADIHFYSDEMLRKAAEQGRENIVEYLLSKGADPDAWGGDPLRNAAGNGHLGVVKKLVEAGAPISSGYGDALERAAGGGHVAVAEYLLEKGADPAANSYEPFLAACRQGQGKMIEMFLSHGVDVNVRDGEGFVTACENKAFDIAKLLLDKGADIDAQGARALRLSAYRGDKETVEFLLANKADPNLRSQYDTPLTEAVKGGNTGIVRLLLENGADLSLMNYEAWRAARRQHNRDMQRALVEGERAAREKLKTEKLREFRATFPRGYSVDDLRETKGPSGDTGLLLAAHTGQFADLLRRAKGGSLVPADLFHPDDRLDSVMGVLHRTKTLQQFFDPAFWTDRTGQVVEAFESLPAGMRSRIKLDAITAQINRTMIMKKMGNGGGAVKPPKITGH